MTTRPLVAMAVGLTDAESLHMKYHLFIFA